MESYVKHELRLANDKTAVKIDFLGNKNSQDSNPKV